MILKNDLLSTGGYLTYVDSYKYPMRAYPKDIDLHYVDVLKRVIISSVRFINKLPFSSKKIVQYGTQWMGEIYDATFRVYERREKIEYSQSSREIWRVLDKINPITSDDRWVRYIVEIWETDQAYRNRGQDSLQELNKKSLNENPKKEILRLFDLVFEREIKEGFGQVSKMKALRKILWAILWSKTFLNLFAEFLKELDINEIKISIEDRYWMANRFDYNYEGKTFEQRMEWKEQEDKNWEKPVLEPEKAKIAIQKPNKAFYELSEDQAQEMIYETSRLLIESWKQNQVISQ